jgi:putative DNA primase/helicase
MPRYTTNDYITALANLGYTFRVNETSNEIEVNNQPINDFLAAEIRAKMRDAGYTSMTAVEDAYLSQAYAHRYHPIKEYLSGLVWDGQPHIETLASHFTDKHNVFLLFFRRWLIGACAKACEGGQNFMLVLAGNQDLGKSFFVHWLCPMTRYFIEGAIETGDKDNWLRLLTYWIWEVGELGATTRRADREALKNFISQPTVTVRKSYGRYDTSGLALANLIGTFNPEGWGFLNDPTGNRRFAVVELTSIDWNYRNAVDVHNIWAEAYALYTSGEDWRLSPDEKQQQALINLEHQAESNLEGVFDMYYQIDDANQNWVSSMEIILHLESMGLSRNSQRASLMELAILMKDRKTDKRKIGNNWCYRGVVQKSPLNMGVTP